MVQFSADQYTITVFIGQEPDILRYYKAHAVFIDDTDLKNEGTLVYVIISQGFNDLKTAIIAFRTNPVNYAGFYPGIHYETESKTLFIGAGTIIKTIRLTDNKVMFQKDYGFGFWSWKRHGEFVIQQEEMDFGVFNIKGEQLWETSVFPPYEIHFEGKNVILKFDDIIETKDLFTGEKR